jgi:hypothetical protein
MRIAVKGSCQLDMTCVHDRLAENVVRFYKPVESVFAYWRVGYGSQRFSSYLRHDFVSIDIWYTVSCLVHLHLNSA